MPCEENLVGQRKGPTVFGEPYFDEMSKSRHELRMFWGETEGIAAELSFAVLDPVARDECVVCSWCFEGRSSAVDTDGIDG